MNTPTRDTSWLRDRLAWSRARHLAARGRPEEALAIASAFTKIGHPPLHWRVFEVQQLTFTGDFAGVLELTRALAATRVNALSADRRYLICYAQWCGQVAWHRLSPTEPMPKYLQFDFRDCPLNGVAGRWRHAFPLSVHPAWRNRWPPRS